MRNDTFYMQQRFMEHPVLLINDKPVYYSANGTTTFLPAKHLVLFTAALFGIEDSSLSGLTDYVNKTLDKNFTENGIATALSQLRHGLKEHGLTLPMLGKARKSRRQKNSRFYLRYEPSN